MKELDGIKLLIGQVKKQAALLGDIEVILELSSGDGDPELLREAEEKLAEVEKALLGLEMQRMLSGENDSCGAILTINAGAGGTEACDWADILLRMYTRWCEERGYKTEVVDFTNGDEAGFRSVTMTIDGEFAYGYLKAENGVHRLVRISPFDANKRRHTSFASVFVIPDIEDDVVIEVDEGDLRIDTFRAGGAGGQHVNKTDSAVRLTHLPTGVVVASQNQRSQHQNKATAMRLLKAKLYEIEMEKKRKERDKIEAAKADIAWGSQIRSYVMQPYQMVKDHRTGVETGNVQKVMDGDIDEFIRQYLLATAKS